VRVSMVVICSLVALAGCGSSSTADEFAGVEVEEAGKEDSARRPTAMGALLPNRPRTGELAPLTSGYHLYTFEGRPGWIARFQVDSADYETYVRVTTPSGRRLSDKGDVLHPIDKNYFALVDLELPEAGTYTVLATSARNMGLFPFGTSRGRYVVEASVDAPCRLGDTRACPSGTTYLHHPDDPAGTGSCEAADGCGFSPCE